MSKSDKGVVITSLILLLFQFGLLKWTNNLSGETFIILLFTFAIGIIFSVGLGLKWK